MVRSKWLGAFAIATCMLMGSAASAEVINDGLNDFLETYQCSLAGLIAKIVAYDKRKIHGRFIVLARTGSAGASYVQCLFKNDGSVGLCEAASGWWDKNPAERPHFAAVQLQELARLGFSTNGSHGNFQQQMQFPPGGPDPYAVADLMLSALFEGYGARKGMLIEVEAPFALQHGYLPQQKCVPIS